MKNAKLAKNHKKLPNLKFSNLIFENLGVSFVYFIF